MWDTQAAVKYLDAHASPISLGRCAEYTRLAIGAGGLALIHRVSAKDYGSSLLAAGFASYGQMTEGYLAGDVVVIQPIPGHPHGHMAMFDGTSWVSDFVQLHGLYPGPAYRSARPPFTIYRCTVLCDTVKPLASANFA